MGVPLRYEPDADRSRDERRLLDRLYRHAVERAFSAMPMPNLVADLGLSGPYASELVNQLVDSGCVDRHYFRSDSLLAITERGIHRLTAREEWDDERKGEAWPAERMEEPTTHGDVML